MTVPVFIPVLVFVGVLGVAFALITLANRKGAVTQRLEEHEVHVAVNEAKRLERLSVLKEQKYSSIGILNSFLRGFKPAQTAAEELTRADVRLSVPQYLLARPLVAAFGVVAVTRVTGVALFAIPVVPVGLMLPRVFLLVQARRRRVAFEGQLAEAIDLLVGALQAGYGFLQAIDSASKEMADPMRGELTRVMEQVNVGATPVEALQKLPKRIVSYDLTLLVTAITVQRSVGGNLAEVLENIAHTVRERRRIRAEVRAITTGPRLTSYILGLFPLGLMMFFVFTDDGYRQVMLHEMIGKAMLGFAAVWTLIGFFLANAVTKVEY